MKKYVSICAVLLAVVCLMSLCVNEFKTIAVATPSAESISSDTAVTEENGSDLSKSDRQMNVLIGAFGGMLVSGLVLSVIFGIKAVVSYRKKSKASSEAIKGLIISVVAFVIAVIALSVVFLLV